MKALLAMVTLGLASCTQDAGHFYAGIVLEYTGGKLVDAHMLGVATSKAHCEAGVTAAAAAAASAPADGSHYVLGCAEIVPLTSVDGVSR